MLLGSVFLVAAFALPVLADARPQRSAAEVLAFKRHNPCPSPACALEPALATRWPMLIPYAQAAATPETTCSG